MLLILVFLCVFLFTNELLFIKYEAYQTFVLAIHASSLPKKIIVVSDHAETFKRTFKEHFNDRE